MAQAPQSCFFLMLIFIYTDYNGMRCKALDPVNTASGARKGREKGGGRGAGCFFSSRISSGVGKAGALEITISLDFMSL